MSIRARWQAAVDRYRADRIAGARLELDWLLRETKRPWQAGRIGGGGALRFPRSTLADVLDAVYATGASVEFIDLDGAFVAYVSEPRKERLE